MSSKGGRWLASIENSVNTLIRRLEDNTKNTRKTNNSGQKERKQHKDQQSKNKETKMGAKQLYAYFTRKKNEISSWKT